jgi:hypothetical protein
MLGMKIYFTATGFVSLPNNQTFLIRAISWQLSFNFESFHWFKNTEQHNPSNNAVIFGIVLDHIHRESWWR